MTGVPWKPYGFTDDDRVLIRLPTPVKPRSEELAEQVRKLEEDAAPRKFRIEKRDVINYKSTPGCPGCYAALNNKSHKPHTNMCRDRIEKAMLEDELDDNRVKRARLREDHYLEKMVKEFDEKEKAQKEKKDQPEDKTVERPELLDQALTHDQALWESNFQDVINAEDEDLVDRMSQVEEDDNMLMNMINILENHVSEIYSPPRVAKLAK